MTAAQEPCVHSGVCRFSKNEDGDCFGSDYATPCHLYKTYNEKVLEDLDKWLMDKRTEFDNKGDATNDLVTKSGWYARSYQCQELQMKIAELRQQGERK